MRSCIQPKAIQKDAPGRLLVQPERLHKHSANKDESIRLLHACFCSETLAQYLAVVVRILRSITKPYCHILYRLFQISRERSSLMNLGGIVVWRSNAATFEEAAGKILRADQTAAGTLSSYFARSVQASTRFDRHAACEITSGT